MVDQTINVQFSAPAGEADKTQIIIDATLSVIPAEQIAYVEGVKAQTEGFRDEAEQFKNSASNSASNAANHLTEVNEIKAQADQIHQSINALNQSIEESADEIALNTETVQQSKDTVESYLNQVKSARNEANDSANIASEAAQLANASADEAELDSDTAQQASSQAQASQLYIQNRLGEAETILNEIKALLPEDGALGTVVYSPPIELLVNSDGTVIWDTEKTQVAYLTLTQDVTIQNPVTQVKPGATYILKVRQDQVGGHNVSFEGNFLFPAQLDIPPSYDSASISIYTFATFEDGYLYGALMQGYGSLLPG